jgi:multicomponent K+:H+ antiporter subunit F
MMNLAVGFAFACFGAGLLMTLWKIVTAKGIGDKILALDTMVINMIALLVLFGVYEGTEIIFEAAMIIAMLGFVSPVAYARFLLRSNIIE